VKIKDVPDIAMMALMGLVSGEDFVTRDGELYLLSGGEPLWVGVDVLVLLQASGWVVLPVLPPGSPPGTLREAVPTRRGREALKEWFRKRFGGRRLDVSKLRPAKLTAAPGKQ
jgi:hypothetical protein